MFFTMLGTAICILVLLQLGLFVTSTFSQMMFNRKQYAASEKWIKNQISATPQVAKNEIPGEPRTWNGFREFFVERLVNETAVCKSVYLKPIDGKPIADFKPGQHLTFKLPVPSERKPLVRCYSLSEGPGRDYYRISVKAIPAPQGNPDVPPGKASNFINHGLIVGDRLEVKAPSGNFHLAPGDTPIVLLAGGIGVTPMISIIDSIVQSQSKRTILLAIGVQNGADHAFKEYINEVTKTHPNIHAVNCYSHPTPEDQLGVDYHVEGFVSVDILKQVLPNNEYLFYLCGPPPFMNSLYNGLLDWNVPESRINFESFGPATIKKKSSEVAQVKKSTASNTVTFAASETTASWNAQSGSLLDLAEQNDVFIDSGCRAGSCGTCATKLLSGKVNYPDGVEPDCESGECLVCVALPDGPVELDA